MVDFLDDEILDYVVDKAESKISNMEKSKIADKAIETTQKETLNQDPGATKRKALKVGKNSLRLFRIYRKITSWTSKIFFWE